MKKSTFILFFLPFISLFAQENFKIENQKFVWTQSYKTTETDILNLIDTPGHVDFAYEVSRSLAACEGAILVVDASQGIQAQTLANLYAAMELDLKIIPVLNKIDLPNADIETRAEEIKKILSYDRDEILCVSAKTGAGVPELLAAIIERIPCPKVMV